jgi:hypothetical protein
LKSFRPIFAFDQLTGEPQVSFDYASPKQLEQSLEGLFHFLDLQGVTIVFAIDEFQQISQYPEKNVEAFLRTLIQPVKNFALFSAAAASTYCTSYSMTAKDLFSAARK